MLSFFSAIIVVIGVGVTIPLVIHFTKDDTSSATTLPISPTTSPTTSTTQSSAGASSTEFLTTFANHKYSTGTGITPVILDPEKYRYI